MAYETPITIKKAIDNIRKRNYVLPSIQREFVWEPEQIETLFDSLMRDYPISTFLFWRVEKTKVKNFQFYEFLNNYHEKDNRHNQKADLSNDEDVIALLDGQQRMTSMYIALTGSYANKMPYYRWDSAHAFPKKKLYLNLLKPSDELEVEYDFKFLAEKDAVSGGEYFWFECSKILDITDMGKSSMYLMKNKLMDTSVYSEAQSEYAINTLNEFYNVVHQKGTISYYLEESEELDKVLQIFIRINSGGTKLSYSDLLLSIATAQWRERDAREVIHAFVDEINQIGDGFSFNKDLVLKACLVLADLRDIKFKVDNFNKENMSLIESKWEKISDAIRSTVELVSKLGYSRDNLMATNAVIPIAYFIYKNEFDTTILHSSARESDRKSVREWLARVFLKGSFGGQPDSIYPVMRNLVNENLGKFPLGEIIERYKGSRKSISFSEDDIENILNLEYGKAKTFCALSLVYAALNYNFKYHQDHIHPKSFFSKRNLRKLGVSEDGIERYRSQYDKLSNLQLLQANQNIEKKDKHFEQWLDEVFLSSAEKQSYLMQNHIQIDESLAFSNFLEFSASRRSLLKAVFMKMLDVAASEQPVEIS